MTPAAGAERDGRQYLVAGSDRGELFEIRAADPVDAVRAVYEAAGGGGTMFDVVAATPARPGYLAVYAGKGDGSRLLPEGLPLEGRERAREILTRIAVPLVRVQAVYEAPMVVVAAQPAAVERALAAAGVPRAQWDVRRAAMAARLRAVASPHPGGVAVDAEPGDRDGPLVKVHARGLPFFRLMRLRAALEAAAAEALAE